MPGGRETPVPCFALRKKNRNICASLFFVQAVLAMKRLGPSTCFPFIVPAAADPAPCPVFAALSYL